MKNTSLVLLVLLYRWSQSAEPTSEYLYTSKKVALLTDLFDCGGQKKYKSNPAIKRTIESSVFVRSFFSTLSFS